MDTENSETLGISMQCITVCSLGDIYLYPLHTQNVFTPQIIPKVSSDPGIRLKTRILCFMSNHHFSSSCLKFWGKKYSSALYMPNAGIE